MLPFKSSKEYTSTDLINAGVFGSVYKLNAKLASKIYDKEDGEGIGSVIIEVAAIRMCNHPNIITLVDVVWEEDITMIVMPLAEMSLRDRLTRIQTCNDIIELEEVKHIGYQLARALYYLEQIDIGHADLKPENILLSTHNSSTPATKKWHVKLCDFGKSRIGWKRRNVKIEEKLQTLWYRAPEVLYYRDYGYKSEVWALGCILYEMATGFALMVGQPDEYSIEVNVCRLFGTPNATTWPGVDLDKLPYIIRQTESTRIWDSMTTHMDSTLYTLLTRMFVLYPKKRCSMHSVVSDPFFSSVRQDIDSLLEPNRSNDKGKKRCINSIDGIDGDSNKDTFIMPTSTEDSLQTALETMLFALYDCSECKEPELIHLGVLLSRVMHTKPGYVTIKRGMLEVCRKDTDTCLSLACLYIAGLLLNCIQDLEDFLRNAGYEWGDKDTVMRMIGLVMREMQGSTCLPTAYTTLKAKYRGYSHATMTYADILILLATVSSSNTSIADIVKSCMKCVCLITGIKHACEGDEKKEVIESIITLLGRDDVRPLQLLVDLLKRNLQDVPNTIRLVIACKKALDSW